MDFPIFLTLIWSTVVKTYPKVFFSKVTTPRCRVECNSLPWIVPLSLDPYLKMLSVKQENIK